MSNRSIRTKTKAIARPWVIVTADTAISAAVTLAPVAQHAALAARGGYIGGNHNELLGI